MTAKQLRHLMYVTLKKNESDINYYDEALVRLYERENNISHRGSWKVRTDIIRTRLRVLELICEMFAYGSFLGWFLYVLNGYFRGY